MSRSSLSVVVAISFGAAVAPLSAQTPVRVWATTKSYHPFGDQGLAVVDTEAGGAIVAIRSEDLYGLARYGAGGEELWSTSFGATGMNFAFIGLAEDGADGVFFVGTIKGSGFADPPLGLLTDAVVARFDGAGNMLWAHRIGGAQVTSGVRDVVADGSGGAIVLGVASGGNLGGPAIGVSDAFLAHYDSQGTELSLSRLGAPDTTTEFNALTTSPTGFHLGGGRFDWLTFETNAAVLVVDHQFSELWSRYDLERDSVMQAIAVGANGDIVTGGQHLPTNEGRLLRLDPTGLILGADGFPGFPSSLSNVWEVEALTDGTFMAIGAGEHNAPLSSIVTVLRRLDIQGNVVSETTFEGTIGLPLLPYSASYDRRGSLFVAGSQTVPVGSGGQVTTDTYLARFALDFLGAEYCPGVPNSTGTPAQCRAVGSGELAKNAVTVFAEGLPQNTLGYFLSSDTPDLVQGPGGMPGTLCLGGMIGRHNRPGEVRDSGLDGRIHLAIDLLNLPSPMGSTGAMSGQVLHFQAWFRDVPAMGSSNFTGAVSVTLQ